MNIGIKHGALHSTHICFVLVLKLFFQGYHPFSTVTLKINLYILVTIPTFYFTRYYRVTALIYIEEYCPEQYIILHELASAI